MKKVSSFFILALTGSFLFAPLTATAKYDAKACGEALKKGQAESKHMEYVQDALLAANASGDPNKVEIARKAYAIKVKASEKATADINKACAP